jgi:hypothetical protein
VTIGFGAIRLSSGLARAVGQARNRTPKAVQRTVPFGLICLSLTVVWYATAGHAPADAVERRSRARWYTTKLGTPQNRAVLAAWAAALRTWLGDHPDHPHGTPADDRS